MRTTGAAGRCSTRTTRTSIQGPPHPELTWFRSTTFRPRRSAAAPAAGLASVRTPDRASCSGSSWSTTAQAVAIGWQSFCSRPARKLPTQPGVVCRRPSLDLESFAEQDRRWTRVLASRTRLIVVPDELGTGDVRCQLTLEHDDDERWLVLSANGIELHRELAVWESTEPAHRLLSAMRVRFGDRLLCFDYDPAMLYLGGDRLSSIDELAAMVADLPSTTASSGSCSGGSVEQQIRQDSPSCEGNGHV